MVSVLCVTTMEGIVLYFYRKKRTMITEHPFDTVLSHYVFQGLSRIYVWRISQHLSLMDATLAIVYMFPFVGEKKNISCSVFFFFTDLSVWKSIEDCANPCSIKKVHRHNVGQQDILLTYAGEWGPMDMLTVSPEEFLEYKANRHCK